MSVAKPDFLYVVKNLIIQAWLYYTRELCSCVITRCACVLDMAVNDKECYIFWVVEPTVFLIWLIKTTTRSIYGLWNDNCAIELPCRNNG